LISLREAKSERAVCKLPRDNFEVADWNIMTDGTTVWISEQKLGRPPTQSLHVPKKIFNRLLAAYEKPQRQSGK
jgi:hypothetical protein